MKAKQKIQIIFAVILVIVACYTFWHGFMLKSDFASIVQGQIYWNAVMEMGIAFWIYVMLLLVPFEKKVYRYGIVGIIYFLFAYLHAFFWASLFCSMYAGFVIATGYIVTGFLGKSCEKIRHEFHYCFVNGIASIIILVGVLSALGGGTPERLRMVFPALFFVELIFLRKKIVEFIKKTWNDKLMVPTEKTDYIGTVMVALVLTAVTIATCRANLGTDYDSLWYGLRSNEVLAPETGIYDKVIMMACVYTYSKGFEAFTLVFSGLRTYSFVLGCNIMLCVMLFSAIYELGKQKASNRASILMVMLAALTPSILNMTITAKSDIATIYLQIVVLLYAVKALKNSDGQYLLASFSALILSFGFKPSSIVFSTIIFLITLILAAKQRISIKAKEWLALSFAVGGLGVLFARTVIITGYPITSLVVGIFKRIGIEPKYPYTLPTIRTMSLRELFIPENFTERFLRLFKIFFAPNTSDIYTLEVSWWGALFTVIWIIAILSIICRPMHTVRLMRQDKVIAFQVWLLLICSAAGVGCMMLLTTPDGNYFILLHALTYWYVGTELYRAADKVQLTLMIPLVMCNFLLCIATSWSWINGLTPIDLSNKGYYNHEEKYIKPVVEANEALPLYEYLEVQPEKKWIACSTREEMMFVLPGTIEVYVHHIVWGANTIADAQAFDKYMHYAGVDGIILEPVYQEYYPECMDLIWQLAQQGHLKLDFTSENYIVLNYCNDAGQKDNDTIQYLRDLRNS